MARWRCPDCDREFGRSRQSHVCVPAGTVAQTFDGRPEVQRQVYEAVAQHVRSLGPVHEDAVGVGVFLKRERTLVEVRPRSRDVVLLLCLPRRVQDPRVSRIVHQSGSSVFHQVPLRTPEDVDDQVRAWLSEAYLAAGDD